MELEERREKKPYSAPFITTPQGREGDKEPGVSSRVAWLLLGDATSPGQAFERWVALVRRRCGQLRDSGFPHRAPKNVAIPFDLSPSPSLERESGRLDSGKGDGDSVTVLSTDHIADMSLWERLGSAATLDIESNDFSWDALSSLHHTEHNSSNEHAEDEMNKALEVTVNSGGVVFFALFIAPESDDLMLKEAAAVVKIASSRMATQSERLGYEFAKLLRVQTPQGRVIHNSSPEWQQIKEATEKARDAAVTIGDEVGDVTCTELLEALELSRCLFLMNYVHGSPLLESSAAFDSFEAARITAAALGRVLMLDLILRNEDRLPCRQLGWRGNNANLLYVDKIMSVNMEEVLDEAYKSAARRYRPHIIKILQKERRVNSVNGRLDSPNPELSSQVSDAKTYDDFHIVAIDSGVPRRPPAGKRAKDHEVYPKVVELILNSSEFAANILSEISGGKLGTPAVSEISNANMAAIVHEFRGGFRAALRDLQSFHIFLLTLYQKLDGLFRVFLSIINKSSGEVEKDDADSPRHSLGIGFSTPCPENKERVANEVQVDLSDSDLQKNTSKPSPFASRDSPESTSPVSRENWGAKYSKGKGEQSHCLRLTMKLRDFNKFAKIDAEMNKELEQWNEMLRSDVVKLCQENNFNSGFFEGTDNNTVIDAYELKVRLEHILERIALISDAANTERPSLVTGNVFIGGALAARSMHTLQHLGITHILCLCSHEIGQSDSQYPDHFEYKNFSISDNEDEEISDLFDDVSDYIDYVEQHGGKVLVHCFEGKSRSATVVLAYLMLRKGLTLSDAWNMLKKAHRRAQPNDGFAKALLQLDKRLFGKVSMEWQHRKPAMKVCPICGKNAGLSTSSLKLHLQKSHKKISLGSVDSAMTMEIQKALEGLRISRSSSISPKKKHCISFNDIKL
ncbi:dual specificity protein phosphatase PHS1-like [Dioscorea cayenensis subsp. rotundata]|uniref:Dual specificity protein phosphatase PHS1-like n=1 Tax=Dioscorea cayennensis subsp. rotundata TaxID=55577 RepID=A0AB40CDU5_DIOCR|nr:dual specificity protein phosphatase PHS1-like [Dioscorea cayenensis subsp. rotundata]